MGYFLSLFTRSLCETPENENENHIAMGEKVLKRTVAWQIELENEMG